MIKRENIITYVKKKFDVSPDFPFRKYPDYAAFRHRNNAKWFCLMMDVSKDKLGMASPEIIDIINVKCSPEKIKILITKKGFFQAYHMNKKSWVTIVLDGSVPAKEIYSLLGDSHELTE